MFHSKERIDIMKMAFLSIIPVIILIIGYAGGKNL